MPGTGIDIWVRDSTLARIGRLDDYVSLQVVPRYNAVGAATVTLSAGSAQAGLMVEGNGLIFARAGSVLMSGPIRTVGWSRDASDGGPGTLTVGVVDDMTVLAEATCWPDPTADLSAQTDPTYKISAVAAETAMRALVDLNIGPGAQVGRQNPLLTLAADGGLGGTIAARQVDQFANLLTTLQSIAVGAGLGFRVVQAGSALQFQVFQPVDRSATARFSFGLGNLTSASYTTTPPTCTVAIVVAGGTDTPRVVQSYSQTDPIFPTLRIEQMVDQTSTSTTDTDLADQMQQAATEALAQGAGQAALTLAPIDIPLLQYGTDYAVGDTVAAMVRDDWYTDVVQLVTLTASAQDGPLLAATIGTSDAGGTTDAVARIYSLIARVKRDVARLTSRKAG